MWREGCSAVIGPSGVVGAAGLTTEAAADRRQLLQASRAPPANCSAPGDKWTPSSIACQMTADYSLSCTFDKTSGNALCQLQGSQPQQLIGMTCPVKSGKAVCDLVVAQNFTNPDVIFAITALLQAWAPAA
ncbi:hypothetical protein N2152v2_005822 [Parachlorella kessleri]